MLRSDGYSGVDFSSYIGRFGRGLLEHALFFALSISMPEGIGFFDSARKRSASKLPIKQLPKQESCALTVLITAVYKRQSSGRSRGLGLVPRVYGEILCRPEDYALTAIGERSSFLSFVR